MSAHTVFEVQILLQMLLCLSVMALVAFVPIMAAEVIQGNLSLRGAAKMAVVAGFVAVLYAQGSSGAQAQDHEDRLRRVEGEVQKINGINAIQDRRLDAVDKELDDHEKRIRDNEEARIYMYAIIAIVCFLSNVIANKITLGGSRSYSKGRIIGGGSE